MTSKNPLQHLADFGQSVWNDNLSRHMIESGELRQLIDNDGVVGITSNPTIFDTAISKSNDYEDQMRNLVWEGRSAGEIQDALMIKDIQDACDILKPIYDATDGRDGVVSLEVSPLLAHDTEKTISEARRLNRRVDRPNVMIKIPGTTAGIPAVEQALYEGINVNITLLFSLDAYRDIMGAYLSAMERRIEEEKPVHDISSVASFFVSRVDSEVDARLEAIIEDEPDSERAAAARAIMGQVAIANARFAYQEFKKIFNSARFSDLAGHGVRIQRPLWASTSTKNPVYPDTVYVDELVGPNTVQTLAPASIEAFRDHGTVKVTIEKDVDVARDVIDTMESLGITYDEVIEVLVREGVEKFADSFHSLSDTIESELSRIATEIRTQRRDELGDIAGDFDNVTSDLEAANAVDALRHSRGAFWSDDSETASEISNLLGWLQTVPEMLAIADIGLFDSLREDVRRRGYDRVVLLGMGGSSLAPEVMAHILERDDSLPRLTVLDSTHPDTIERIANSLDSEYTLFIVSSKSGSTIETATLFEYFLSLQDGNADDFIIITDPGSPLESRARNLNAWKVFTNRHDIGGRFSALSYFGLVPAAVTGIDVPALLDDAASVLPVHDIHHPGIALGAALASAADSGRNKLTLICADHWASFGDWLEQLIAESTGKHGTGIVPIAREPMKPASEYGSDRVFAVIDDGDEHLQATVAALREAGHPVIGVPARLGQLFMTWEIATAIVGKQLEINPFDQPNVQEAKDQTNRVLSGEVSDSVPVSTPSDAVEFVLREASNGKYVTIQAFVDASDEMVNALSELRVGLAEVSPAPIALGIGPRFLHSTGQLHKGGPDQGVFLQIYQQPSSDIEIPGRELGFQRLFEAQADGDLLTLTNRDLRVVRVNVDSPADIAAMANLTSQAGVAAD